MAPLWRDEAFRMALRLSGDEMEADDVAQDAMLRLWQMRERMDGIRCPEHFVRVVVRNLWIDRCRHSRTLPLDTQSALTEGLDQSAHQVLEWRETEQWLERTMARLPSTQRAVLQLRQVEQRSHREIAQLLCISETSVSTLLGRARRTLLEEFKKTNRL